MSKYIARRGFIRDHYENLTNKIMNKAKKVNIIDEYFNKDMLRKSTIFHKSYVKIRGGEVVGGSAI